MARRALVLLTLLLPAAPAQATHFVVAKHGASPAVAVDDAGATHVIWDVVDARTGTSTTHYCVVPRKGRGCAARTGHAFGRIAGAQDFAGPQVFVRGRTVTVVFSRCCKGETAPDAVYEAVSSNGGLTFAEPRQIGTLAPDVDLAPMGSAFAALGSTDSGLGLQELQANATEQNALTKDVAESGGVGIVPNGVLVAYAAQAGIVRTTLLTGDLASAKPAFSTLAHGSDVDVASGPKGADLLYLTPGDQGRYVLRRYLNNRFGSAVPISERGAPIYGRVFQDGAGRAHVAWIGDRGFSYRRRDPTGHLGKVRTLAAATTDYNDLAVAANAAGRAAVVYGQDATSGTIGGFSIG